MARKYPYDDSAEALLRPASRQPFFEDWTDKDTDSDDLLCAEMARLAYASEATVTERLRIPGFALEQWLGASTFLNRIATRGTEGFVARHPGKRITVVAFRGTEATRPEDLFVDLLAGFVAWGGGSVHRGFAMAYEPVRGKLADALERAEPALLITGHSLGAALATLAAAEHRARSPRLVTFGSPRVGDAHFRAMLDGIAVRRFVNCADVVTRVPPARFDDDHIRALIEDLTGPNAVSRGAALVLSTLLSRIDADAQFVHVGPARYADLTGREIREVADDEADPDVQADRARARQAYRQGRRAAPSGGPFAFGQGLGALATDPFGAVSRGIADVLDALREARVPVRDLADHAPINYVSLWSGRL
jgi:hypothetical protein